MEKAIETLITGGSATAILGSLLVILGYAYWNRTSKLDADLKEERTAHLETVKTVLPALQANTTSNNEVGKALDSLKGAVKAIEDNTYELLVRDGVRPRRSKTEA